MSGFGHPEWAKTHEAASRTSLVVSALVDGGATCVGKTVIDELAYRYVVVFEFLSIHDAMQTWGVYTLLFSFVWYGDDDNVCFQYSWRK